MIRHILGHEKKLSVKTINSLPDERRQIAVFNGEVRYVDAAWQHVLDQNGFSSSADWSQILSGECVSRSEITNCFKVKISDTHSVYFKRYTYPKAKQKRYWMRASKAQVEVFGYRQLDKIGIPTLKVVAFGEKRHYGQLVAAYIMTQAIPDSVDLQQFASQQWLECDKQTRNQIYLKLKKQIFDQLTLAHQVNFFHQDLHWRNILVTKHGQEYKTTWIDCPRAAYRRLPFNSKHGQMVDLSCLARRSLDYISRSERYRILSEYLKLNNKGWTEESLFKEIQAHHIRSPNPPKPLGIEGFKKQFFVKN